MTAITDIVNGRRYLAGRPTTGKGFDLNPKRLVKNSYACRSFIQLETKIITPEQRGGCHFAKLTVDNALALRRPEWELRL